MPDSVAENSEIGPYRIIRCIGEGGKGRVYEAEQSIPVRRKVALKVLRSSSNEPGDVIRFSAEQQALALMDHPGIAKVFDAGTEEDGRQWFAMELIDGLPLAEFADAHEFDVHARIQLFIQVCRAVQHAHQKGVIHRDLKPSNVLVTMEDGVASPRVIDFGVAKSVGLRLTDETLMTQFGAIIGTPAYMSPEQADGTIFEIDTRADIYSLGVMLYELLVGCLPVDPRVTGYPGFIAFLKDADQDAPVPATRFRQLQQEQQNDIASARQQVPSQLRATLAGDLRWILASALEKDPARRYNSAAALADDLEQFSSGDVVSATPPSVGYQARKFIARNRVFVTAAAMVILALAGGTIAATIGMIRAEREAIVANAVSEFFESVFAEASPFSRSGEEVTVRQLLDRAAENIETQLDGQPLVQGRLMLRIGAAYRGLGLFHEATPLLERSLILLHEGDAAELQIADAEYELGYHLIFVSQFERASVLMTSAIEYYRRELGHSDHRLAVAVGDLTFSALRSSQGVPAAFEMLEQELELAAAELGENHTAVAQLMYMRCWSLRHLRRPKDALKACHESLQRVRKIYPGDVPVLGHNTLALGHTHRALGNYETSLEFYDDVVGINTRLYGVDHAEIAYAYMGMSASNLQLGRRDAALDSAEVAVGMLAKVHGKRSPEYARALGILASVFMDLHRFDEAEALHHEIVDINFESFGTDSIGIAYNRSRLAEIRLQQGRYAEAEELASLSLEVLKSWDGGSDEGMSSVLMTLGQALHRLNKFDQAEPHLRSAYEVFRLSPEDTPVQLATASLLLSRLLFDREEFGEACEMAISALDSLLTIYGPDNWRTAVAATVHGACQVRNGQHDAGIATMQNGISHLEATLFPGNIYLTAAQELAARFE